jgi:hypothetical protein
MILHKCGVARVPAALPHFRAFLLPLQLAAQI